ncbi:MAG TPA: hypothetical protein VGM83_11185 [Devosiaceae bacterium]|jgi:4-hydroxyphenylpyruvate dioxygenase-like putative hemolysin
MRSTKALFSSSDSTDVPLNGEQAEQQLALEYLAEAWNAAEDEGIDKLALAHASLFAALATLVRLHGDDGAADLVAELPDRLRSGEYNLDRSLQ